MATAVGIDLGTTNSAIARIDEYGKPVLIQSESGESLTPSVVAFQDGEIVVGEEAKELQASGYTDVAAFFKREMGNPNFYIHGNGKRHSPVDLSSYVLAKLKADAEASLGESIKDGVITVPAYFRNPERQATIAAGRKAGLNVLQTINEPTAAAMAYGLRAVEQPMRILVYDLGGGTFDVVLMRIDAEELRILTSRGDHELGGKNWDSYIVNFLGSQFLEEFGVDPYEDAEDLFEAMVRAEEAKKQLSAKTRAKVTLRHGGNTGRYELTREKLAELTGGLMQQTANLCAAMLEEQGITPDQIDGVLLVGGSTRMEMVHSYVKEVFGKVPMGGVNVDEAVALGAALKASELTADRATVKPGFSLPGRLKTFDVTNHSLGMIAENVERTAYVNTKILPKSEPMPCVQSRLFQVPARRSGETYTEIYMTQGESDQPADVCYLGKYVVKNIPTDGKNQVVVDIEYRYDESETVKVSAHTREGRRPLEVAVEALPDDVPARFLEAPEPTPVAEPVTVYLVFDVSGSMSGQPLREAKDAARGFLKNIDLTHCAMGLGVVSNATKQIISACQEANRIGQAITSIEVGMTGHGNSAHPFDDIRRWLGKVSGRRIAIVLADGVWDNQDTAVSRAQECHKEGIDIVAIGFGGADEGFLRRIASAEENGLFTDLNQLQKTFSTIAQVITEISGNITDKGSSAHGDEAKRGFLRR